MNYEQAGRIANDIDYVCGNAKALAKSDHEPFIDDSIHPDTPNVILRQPSPQAAALVGCKLKAREGASNISCFVFSGGSCPASYVEIDLPMSKINQILK